MSWEDTFTAWAKPPGQTEQDKCDNAETAIRKAIAADPILSAMDITVFPQGSYKARTNIKLDSDVDICIRLNSTFFEDYPAGKARGDFGNIPGSILYSDFKKLVGNALIDYFPAGSVTPGKKAFDIHANTYRVDADVVATFEMRRYTGKFNSDGSHHYYSGVAFVPDGSNNRIENWPEQAYDSGVEKRENTGHRYKKIVRILKRLRNKMQEDNIAAATNIASFLIESLVWNVPNNSFGHDTYRMDVRETLAHTFNATLTDQACEKWLEVSRLKWLFRPSQPWTRDQAHKFLSAAWDYLELT